MPLQWAGFLDCQPEHGGEAVGGGAKSNGTNEPQQICGNSQSVRSVGRPEVPLQWAGFLDCQPEHGGEAIG